MIRKRKAADGTRYTPEVWDPRTGKRTGAKALLGEPGTYTTLKDAKRVERRMHTAIEAMEERPKDAITVGEWIDRWLTDYPRPKQNSRQTYKRTLKPLTEGKHADVPLQAYTRQMARELAQEHPHCARVAHTAWQDAIHEAEVITFNPWAKLKLPAKRARTLALTEQEIVELAGCAHVLGRYRVVMGNLIVFAAYSGMRVGELAAMRWDWVDGQTIRVCRNRGRDGVETAPKHREDHQKPQVIALFPPAAQALREIPRSLTGFVWTGPRGGPLNHSALNVQWARVRLAFLLMDRPVVRQRELEAVSNGEQHDLCFHTLRHSCASVMAERGYDRLEIAAQLRHRDLATADRYTHVIDEREKRLQMVERFTPQPIETVATTVAKAD